MMKAGKVSFKVILYSFADSDYASMYSVATVYIIFDVQRLTGLGRVGGPGLRAQRPALERMASLGRKRDVANALRLKMEEKTVIQPGLKRSSPVQD